MQAALCRLGNRVRDQRSSRGATVPKTQLNTVSAWEAAQSVTSGMRVRFPLGHAPMLIADCLAARIGELESVEVTHTAAGAMFPWFQPGLEDTFSVVQEHWAGPLTWPMMRARQFDYLPMPFSLRFKAQREGRTAAESRRAEVVCIQCSPPDKRGMVNLGRMIWDAPEFIRQADIVLAEIVPDMPIICGDGNIPADLITYFVDEGVTPVSFVVKQPYTDSHLRIAEHLMTLIADGDTLQIGAGTASVLVGPLMDMLMKCNDLGWHSETTPYGIPGLIRSGVMNSVRIPSHPGVAVSASWPVGDSEREFVERNPAIQGREIGKITDPRAVAQIPNFRAINSVMMFDLTGQAAAESIGTQMASGVGGLLEFMIGALWSEGGRSILVAQATDPTGQRSRIVPTFPQGTQVSVPRTLVDTVVTEFGVARLFGKTVRERSQELIRVADPKFRDQLKEESRRLFYP
jgi:4-hydroxybutyrate CoA-transferase